MMEPDEYGYGYWIACIGCGRELLRSAGDEPICRECWEKERQEQEQANANQRED